MMTDEELHHLILEGSTKAFDELYQRYGAILIQFLGSLLKNQQDAEEIFQEVFLVLLKSPQLRFEDGSVRGWLFLTARSRALNHLRSVARHDAKSKKFIIEREIDRDIVDAEATAGRSANLEFEKKWEALRAGIQELPGHLRKVADLKMSGLGHGRIAASLGIPVGTVKSRLYHIRKFLSKETV